MVVPKISETADSPIPSAGLTELRPAPIEEASEVTEEMILGLLFKHLELFAMDF